MQHSLTLMKLGKCLEVYCIPYLIWIRAQSFIYVKMAEDGSSKLEGYYNYLNRGSSFLKALGLNGAQYGSDFYAGMYFGSSFECVVTDINGANVLKKGKLLLLSSAADNTSQRLAIVQRLILRSPASLWLPRTGHNKQLHWKFCLRTSSLKRMRSQLIFSKLLYC